MRLLILSETIHHEQAFSEVPYSPPYDVQLDTGDLSSTDFNFSIFDYDVSVVHIEKPSYHTIGYYENLPKLLRDCEIALKNGLTIMCLPESPSFVSERLGERGMGAYEWLEQFGIVLQDNTGTAIRPSGAGRTKAISEYLKYAPRYHQIVMHPKIPPDSRLAVVDDTEIVVGGELEKEKGILIVLPPPVLDRDHYHWVMSLLVGVARRYYDHAQRRVPIGDSPQWVEGYLALRAKTLATEIESLSEEKAEYDKIAYVLYGTGEDLEESVALLLEKLGLSVERQSRDAIIDLKARHQNLGLDFAIEVTGTKGTIQSDSDKVGQAWKYIQERAGTPKEKDRLIIVANTERHLDPHQRMRDSFSREVVDLLGKNGVLLITTVQLYTMWKEVHEEQRLAEDVIRRLHGSSGILKQSRRSEMGGGIAFVAQAFSTYLCGFPCSPLWPCSPLLPCSPLCPC